MPPPEEPRSGAAFNSSTGTFAPTPPAPTKTLRNFDERLSLPLALRLPLAVATGSLAGFLLGIAKGSQDVGYRFQAENAHRLPNTQTGWFLYHKSKNYNMMLGGIVEGAKQGLRLAIWSGMYFVLEEGIDRGRAAGVRLYRKVVVDGEYSKRSKAAIRDEEITEAKQVAGNRDCVSSMLAGLGAAGMFSAWNRLPLPTAARTAKMGAKAGLAFGLLQDALSVARGRRVGYVEFLKTHLFGVRGDREDMPVPATATVTTKT